MTDERIIEDTIWFAVEVSDIWLLLIMNQIVPWMAAQAVLPYAVDLASRVGEVLEAGFAALLGQDVAPPSSAPEAAGPGVVGSGVAATSELFRWLEVFHQRLAQLVDEAGVSEVSTLDITMADDGRLTLVGAGAAWGELQRRVRTDELLRLAFQAIDSIVPGHGPMASDGGGLASSTHTGRAHSMPLRLRWTPESASVLS
ncbi:MAG: hypothetical protein KatS3mg110_3412 [Pirellulaceae bacterium]|nr:MAG: hypothetical protein KatS3mg110_3412 [Pirellulaceae bacterium]